MGCICSKRLVAEEPINDSVRERESKKYSVQLIPPTKGDVTTDLKGDGSNRGRVPSRVPSISYSGSLSGSSRPPSKVSSKVSSSLSSTYSGSLASGYSGPLSNNNKQGNEHQGEKAKIVIVERPSSIGSHHRRATLDLGANVVDHNPMNRIISIPGGPQGEQLVAGWPSWLTSVAGEAIQGWLPRQTDSFEKLDKIGQGTYSSVYKARDLKTGKIVALKKVRFVNMDPESVRFMAREINILRKLDHPNIMKLEGLVTSKMSGNLYLIFEYMEHDLAGLSATPGIKFTEAQIKCYMKQLLSGLEHCHSRGVLHRDIKGSNLLLNNDGILKIGDFGLANFFKPDHEQPLTSRVVTLWYRAPELLLGSTNYGVAVDMWSVGCIIAELFAGKPIMPGRTEVEQMHKIFKLCGSPSESYWKKTKFPHATSFKPQQPYKRRLIDTFKDFPPSALSLVDSLLSIEPDKRGTATSALKSQFFTTSPLPCDPSSLPKYQPTKEFDIKFKDEEARRQKAEAVKGRGPESVRRGPRESKQGATEDVLTKGQNGATTAQGNGVTAFTVDTRRINPESGLSHCSSMLHPTVVGASWTRKAKEDDGNLGSSKVHQSSRNGPDKSVSLAQGAVDLYRKDDWAGKDSGYIQKKCRINYSGPLVPVRGSLEDMLKEHERQIQQAVRKSRTEKTKLNNN